MSGGSNIMGGSIRRKRLEGLASLACRSWIPAASGPNVSYNNNQVRWNRNSNQQHCLRRHSHSTRPSSSSWPGFLAQYHGHNVNNSSGSGRHAFLVGLWARPSGVGSSSSSNRRLCGRLYSSSSSGSKIKKNVQHALLCKEDLKEWVENQKLAVEDATEMRSKSEDLSVPSTQEQYKNTFLRSIIPWEKINVTWETFPYHISEESKRLLVECAASHLGRDGSTPTDHGSNKRLKYSSERVLLQSVAGSELYRERVVKALARDLEVPLLIVASDTLHYSYDLDDDDDDDDNSLYEYFGWTAADESKFSALQKFKIFRAISRVLKHLREKRESLLKPLPPTPPLRKDTEVKPDVGTQSEKCYIAMEALCEVLRSMQRLIVYFPGSSPWLTGVEPQSDHTNFICELQERFDELSVPVLLICGNSKPSKSSWGEAKLPPLLEKLTDALQKDSNSDGIKQLFTNVLSLHPPEKKDLLRAFNNRLEEDIKVLIRRHNLNLLHEVLEEHELTVANFWHIDTNGRILTREEVEKVVGWAKNHYLSTCPPPSISSEKVQIPGESFETAILRLKDQEAKSKKPSHSPTIKLAANRHEETIASAMICPAEINVKFDDIGALEHVKKTLNDLIILPMRRPKLFSHGNLLQPCKGILLFGPPGTGKTLLAKALATEAGTNFINIASSTISSMWYGEEQKNVKALFSFASKVAPVIIFIDEVDSIFGEHGATRKTRNEFMTEMDGLMSKETKRILIIGATNRPFDLDDAFIRRLPRRIYVDLPDAENRRKILKIILKNENLESNFDYDKLAHATEGYSGSDLKNLCTAAAYRPVQELLEQEKKESKNGASSILRPLNLEDFVQSTAQVGPSVFNDGTNTQKLRKWNEKYGEGGSSRFKDPLKNLQNLAMDEYESKFVSEVVRPGEINVKFDDIGALDSVKKTLNDFIILPMRNPELFSHGNLMRPCKGILLFGPPGTGKTLIAKALATEAGAHFISITNSTIASMWHGEEEKNIRGLFSFASRLSPVIIFVDEADSIFGARGRAYEGETTRKTRNEFMAAMDGLKSNDTQRIHIIAATNRPFDLDDAFIRRLPKRIYLDLPDAENRRKILKILLEKEKLEANFEYEKLAHETEGYSGSDLKNLCIAAAYRPVLEHVEQGKKESINDVSSTLRPLSLQDFLLSKTEVGPSVANDSHSIRMLKNWNEQYGQGGSRQNSSPFGFAAED